MRCQSRKLAGDSSTRDPVARPCACQSCTRRAAPGKGSGRISTWSVIENAAVVAPTPSAATTTTVSANPGERPRLRRT